MTVFPLRIGRPDVSIVTGSRYTAAKIIFYVVTLPAETPLIRYAQENHKSVISGAEVFAIQAVEQFILCVYLMSYLQC